MRAGKTPDVESGRPPFIPRLYGFPRRCLLVCAISAPEGGGHLPAALPGPRRQASGAKSAAPSVRRGPESVPLEAISPVRNALRPRRLPTAAALGSRPLRRPGTLGAAPWTVTTPTGPQARPPTPRPAPRLRPQGSPGPRPWPERRLESPPFGVPPGSRGSGACRTSAPQGGGGAGRLASRPIPRRQKAEAERRTTFQHRRGTFSARARAAGGTVAGGRFPELPSVTPVGPSQPGTNTATAILPRPRPQAPPPPLPHAPPGIAPPSAPCVLASSPAPPHVDQPRLSLGRGGSLAPARSPRTARSRRRPSRGRRLTRNAPGSGAGDALLVTPTPSP